MSTERIPFIFGKAARASATAHSTGPRIGNKPAGPAADPGAACAELPHSSRYTPASPPALVFSVVDVKKTERPKIGAWVNHLGPVV